MKQPLKFPKPGPKQAPFPPKLELVKPEKQTALDLVVAVIMTPIVFGFLLLGLLILWGLKR